MNQSFAILPGYDSVLYSTEALYTIEKRVRSLSYDEVEHSCQYVHIFCLCENQLHEVGGISVPQTDGFSEKDLTQGGPDPYRT